MQKRCPQNIDLPEELFLALTRGYGTIRKHAKSLVEHLGVSLSEYHLLRIVQNERRTTATVIKKKLSATAPTIAQMIANLERKQLIKRVKGAEDKRMQYVTLTPQGKNIVAGVRKKINEAADALSLSSDILRETLKNIRIISSALSSSPSSHGSR